jgi:fructuronate reductase
LADWIDSHVDFATSMVDRITPGTTDEDRALVQQACGYIDAYPVATEPFSEWVVSGGFPAGRPRWEDAGAALVADVEPFEQRKLWLLNGSHSMLAYAGSIRGMRRSMKPSPIRAAGRGWRCSGTRQAAISPSRPLTSPPTGQRC